MKTQLFLGVLLLGIVSCQNSNRYTQESPEIEIVKEVLTNYDYQDWEKMVTHYADTAKIYHNTRVNVLVPEDLPEYFQKNDVSFSTRAFEDENREYEMIVDDNGNKWVNFWGLWKGNLVANNKEIVIPVHITTQFVDGKIVKEYGYWNRGELVLEIQSIVNKSIEEDSLDIEE
ncbi:nuclear transport factor 2 family protein [Ichthyenterobacterium sp. W332]|uniref:Nuclear transport factor 2 family protein n=1 Tax=Microcosmobacter mediterraneus TaxID=3075607 RepID=A0ABU2YHJ3_9FLAO|nr:nuclear transport factor 2 family protein [Ichthyenterobacterium sp. W332]MDT0557282.1 nuclear transport factor 2 family protein [Ichthyenterobacterium sp. W332]